jgi:hypothetical protein
MCVHICEGAQMMSLCRINDRQQCTSFSKMRRLLPDSLRPEPDGGSKAAGLLVLRVRILPAACMNVSFERCVVHVEDSATGRSPVQGSPTDCECVIQCDHVKHYPSTLAHNEWVEAIGLKVVYDDVEFALIYIYFIYFAVLY